MIGALYRAVHVVQGTTEDQGKKKRHLSSVRVDGIFTSSMMSEVYLLLFCLLSAFVRIQSIACESLQVGEQHWIEPCQIALLQLEWLLVRVHQIEHQRNYAKGEVALLPILDSNPYLEVRWIHPNLPKLPCTCYERSHHYKLVLIE